MINTVTSSAAPAPNEMLATQRNSKLDYDSFLKLLVTQLKNQDPTKPMDSTEYIAQLATFSNVEQAITANSKLDELIQNSRVSQAIGLIGKTVTSQDGLGSGVVETIRFSQDGIVAKLTDGNELLINARVTIGS